MAKNKYPEKYNQFNPPNPSCNNGRNGRNGCRGEGYFTFTCDASGLSSKSRCACSEIETERYTKALNKYYDLESEYIENPTKHTQNKLEKINSKLSKFIDNNCQCNSKDNVSVRSW